MIQAVHIIYGPSHDTVRLFSGEFILNSTVGVEDGISGKQLVTPRIWGETEIRAFSGHIDQCARFTMGLKAPMIFLYLVNCDGLEENETMEKLRTNLRTNPYYREIIVNVVQTEIRQFWLDGKP